MSERVSWSKVLDGVEEALAFFNGQGVKPTLRTLFYNLYSKGLIGNTRSAYQSLSKQLVKARKEGRFSWDFLEDKTRMVRGRLNDSKYGDDEVEDLERRLENKLEELDLEKLLSETFDYMMPFLNFGRWAKQPVAVELWIEKEALASTFENWTNRLEVPIRVNRGYSSWTFIYNNIQDLRETLTKHDKVVVLYLGDLDPSGVDIERFLNESLEYFDMSTDDVLLVRLGVTDKQVEEYHLPPAPEDAETLAKLQRDPRMRTYEHNYIVELDALIAYVPQEFRKVMTDAILDHWEKEIYEEIEEKADEMRKQSKELIGDYKDKARDKFKGTLEDD